MKTTTMAFSILFVLSLLLLVTAAASNPSPAPPAEKVKPLQVLMITGGCCHDYESQKEILSKGISARANVKFDIVHEGGAKDTDVVQSPFKKKNFSKGYDLILHNECSAKVGEEIGLAVAREHSQKGVAAVMIHCAFHTFRDMESDEWRKCLGVTTRRHGKKLPIKVTFEKPDHPILLGLKGFTTGNEELYQILEVWPKTVVLATGSNSSDKEPDQPLFYATTHGKARIFGTTLGHTNETMLRDDYMEIITRGLLWACGKLDEDGTPMEGYGPQKIEK